MRLPLLSSPLPGARPAVCVAALTLLLSASLSACTTVAEEPAAETAAEPAAEQSSAQVRNAGLEEPEDPYAVTDPELSERLHLPLYDYVLDEYERWTVRQAHDALVVECLNELGFEASANTGTRANEVQLTHFGPHHEYRRYGIARADLAGEHGFEVALGDDSGDPYVIAEGFDEEAAHTAVTGFSHTGEEIETPSGDPVPEGGCTHQANLELSPDSPPPGENGSWSADEGELLPDTPGLHHLVEDLLGVSFFTGMEDPAVRAAAEAWRECAGVSGYSVGPGGASEVMGNGDAVLSAECLDSSGYLDAFVAAETRAQEAMAEEHGDVLAERRDQLQEELAAARAVLGW